MRVGLFLLIISLICVSSAQARIYTCKDQNGNTIYTDNPAECSNTEKAEEVKTDALPSLIEIKPVATPTTRSDNKTTKTDKDKYTSLSITSPASDENVRNNEGDVTIAFQSSPTLQTRLGHQYVVTLSGEEVYKGTQSNVILRNVNRGTHAVTAKIVARNGRTLISAPTVQFTLHRFSRLQNEGAFSQPSPGSGGSGGGTVTPPPTLP